MQRELEARDYVAIWGTPTPTGWNRAKRLRSQTGVVPGVAIFAPLTMNMRYRAPVSIPGQNLEKRGRLVLASYPVRSTQILIVNAYLPSGGSEAVVKDRRACLSDLHTELSTYGDVPIVITADWNLEPSDNPLVPLLLQKGWHLPLVCGPSDPPFSYRSGNSSTLIDYCMCSRRIPVASQVIRMNPTQHQLLALELPEHNPMTALWEVPRPVTYSSLRKPNSSNDGLWTTNRLPQNHDVEQAWQQWQDTFHLSLLPLCEKGPKCRPGGVIFRKAQSRCRLTDQGGETEQAVVAFKLAHRIAEHAQQPSTSLLHSILSTPLPKHLQAFSEQQLHAQPQQLVTSIRDETGKYLKAVVQKRIRKWHQTLSDQAQNPTSHLYKWLKNEGPSSSKGPVGPVVLSIDGKPLQTMTQVFQAHRDHWQEVCCHPEPHLESTRLRNFVQSAIRSPSEPISGKEVLAAAQRMNHKSVGGLDSWSPSVLKGLDLPGAEGLADVYNLVLQTGVWPKDLVAARVSLLHKPGTPADRVSSWRPITITSCFYRLFARVVLEKCIGTVLPHLPSEMLGGLPGRSTDGAIMRVFLWVEQIARSRAGTLYGISLDASKCFDRISIWDALAAGAACGIPAWLLGGVGSFYLAHKRFTSIRQHIDPYPWKISRGLIQGCSVSVLLTCCVLKT